MKSVTQQDVEKLLREASFPNPSHKDALRERLFGNPGQVQRFRKGERVLTKKENGILELSLDNLEMVAAGAAESERQRAEDREAGMVCRYCGRPMERSSVLPGNVFACRCGAVYDPSAMQKWTPPLV